MDEDIGITTAHHHVFGTFKKDAEWIRAHLTRMEDQGFRVVSASFDPSVYDNLVYVMVRD